MKRWATITWLGCLLISTLAAADSTKAIRIKAGTTAELRDSSGNVWQAENGFDDGDVAERPADLAIQNTKNPELYRSEHFGMSEINCAVPNGKYQLSLHFAETYSGINGPGKRVFSFEVAGHEFNNFDIYAKAGGLYRAYVEKMPVEIKDGYLRITFTFGMNNPVINAIELEPIGDGAK